MTVVET